MVYYPYLRARMHDVIAVANAATQLAATGKILPVFEPVQVNSRTLVLRASRFASTNLPVSLIMNPQVGELVGMQNVTAQLLADMRAAGATVTPAFIVQQSTLLQEVQTFLTQHPGQTIYVHQGAPPSTVVSAIQRTPSATNIFWSGAVSASYPRGFANPVLLQDAFKAQTTNASYPPRSYFGDLHLTYSQSGFSGFGDFATIGDRFRVGGGPAYAVVIHMTEDFQTQGIFCNHFLSTSNQTPANPAGKFGQAVQALIQHSLQFPGKIDFTNACQELIRRAGQFPGLGAVKRLSIQHHLELMCTLV